MTNQQQHNIIHHNAQAQSNYPTLFESSTIYNDHANVYEWLSLMTEADIMIENNRKQATATTTSATTTTTIIPPCVLFDDDDANLHPQQLCVCKSIDALLVS
jgi:hypothetical protein